MSKHYLSVIALVAVSAVSAWGKQNTVSVPQQLLQRDTAYSLQTGASSSATEASARMLEQQIDETIRQKEEALAQRFMTQFEVLDQMPPADVRLTAMQLTLQPGVLSTPRQQSAPGKAFTIPGDSLNMIAKDFSFNGSLYVAPVTVKQDGDSIAIQNLYGWGSMSGYRAPRAYVDNTGKVTIPAQLVLTHATYGNVWIAPMEQRATGIVYSFDAITGQMDAQGNISVGGWGLFVPQGNYQNTLFNAFERSEWKPTNAVVTSHKATDNTDVVSYALVEQNDPGELTFYNISGGDYGEVLYARMNTNKTASISPQKVFTNAMLGEFYCYPATYEGTNAKVDMQGNITVTPTADGLELGGWAITARGASNYAAAFYTTTTIATTFAPTWPESHSANFEGQGTKTAPYKLKTANDLAVLAEKVNAGDATYASAYYELNGDIDWSTLSYAFQPIGTTANPFAGHIDGKNHTIKGFAYNGRGFYDTGLFGVTAQGSTMSDLNLTNVNLQGGGRYTAPLAAQSWSALTNINVQGTVTSRGECAGGVVGVSYAPITSTAFSGTVSSGGTVGGIAGDAYASITKSHVAGSLSTVGYINSMYRYLGGIAGSTMMSSTVGLPVEIADCYVEGTITDQLGYAMVGGITAMLANEAEVHRCFNTASISAQRLASQESDNATGGIVAWAREGVISDCYNAGTIVKTGNSDFVGGVIGYLAVGYSASSGRPTEMVYTTDVQNCYNSAQIVSSAEDARKGVIGSTYYYLNFDPIASQIHNCYMDVQVLGMRGTDYDLTTSALTSGTLPASFSSSIWQASAGSYPTLKSIPDCLAVRLSAMVIKFADGESSAKFKSPATLSAATGITWKLYDNESFVDATDALAISGNQLTVKDRYSNSVLVALAEGTSMRLYRLAVVPKLFDGEGTQESPYLIKNVADFKQLNEAVGTYGQPHEGDFFRMANDIDFQLDMNFRGVGAGYSPSIGFGGTFDGANHTIHNLRIAAAAFDDEGKAQTAGSYAYSGLFNNILKTGTVRNLNIAADCQLSHWGPGGAISGYNMGLIENCRNYAPQVAITDYVGGITGYNYNTGIVRSCYNAGLIVTGRTYAGGIVGANCGAILACQNDGDVQGRKINLYINNDAQNSVGGIAGGCATEDARIENCLNQGTVSAWKQLGGIAGNTISSMLIGNINTGLVSCYDEVPTRGAIVGSFTSLDGENNYFDGSVNLCEAANSSGRPGFISLSTAALTSGTAPAGFPNANLWNFTAGAYPTLKAFANEPASKALSKIYIGFADNETRANVQHTTALSANQGNTWTLAGNNAGFFSVSGNNLNVNLPQGMVVGRDTLTAQNGEYVKTYFLQTVPVIFDGAGTAQSPYQIKSADDINRLSEFIWNTGFDYANTYFKVMNDIVFAETDTLSPIAKGGSHQFSGIFDGNGKKISGFKYENTVITNTAAKPHPLGYPGRYLGFFAKVGSTGRISNLTLEGTMNVYSHVGGVVGDLYGSVDNCHVTSAISSTNAGYVGGIASRVYAGGSVTNCTFKGALTPKNTFNGGIAAYVFADGLVENCQMSGSMKPSSSTALTTNGGIVGDCFGIIRGCKTMKEAQFTTSSSFGGIAYRLGINGLIEDCENYADLKAAVASATYYGGIVAITTTKSVGAAIRRCTNYGNITAKGYTGGIVANLQNGIVLEDCANYGVITSDGSSYTGGIAANTNTATADYPLIVRRCVNYGDVHGFASYIGGVAGSIGTLAEGDSLINYGNVYTTATSSHLAVGGVIGATRGTLSRSLNAGTVSTVGHGTGGVTGIIQSGTLDRCANIGDVTSTGAFPTSSLNGVAGGLVGYTVTGAAIYNCYTTGNITGNKHVSGLIGRAAATTPVPLENCYNNGKITSTSDDADPVSSNLYVRNSGVTVNGVHLYYNSDLNPVSSKYDPGNTGRTSLQMQTIDLSDEYTYTRAMLPRLTCLTGISAADINAIALDFTRNGDSEDNINETFYIGYPDENLVWEVSEQFRLSVSDPGKVYPVKLGNGTIKVSTPDGKISRTFNLTVKGTTGVDQLDQDGAYPVSSEYYDLQGSRIYNPAAGSICIVRTLYSNGTVQTTKQVIR